MILCIKTDNPLAEIFLVQKDGTITDRHTWQAHRTLARDLLKECQKLCEKNATRIEELGGIVVYKGPGSFTGLRISATVANTIAYSLDIPIVGSEGDAWLKSGIGRIIAGNYDRVVMPHYGAGPHITSPSK